MLASKLTCRPAAAGCRAVLAAGVAPSNRSCLMVLSTATPAGSLCPVGRAAAEASAAAATAAARPFVLEKLRRLRMDLRLPPTPAAEAGAWPAAAAKAGIMYCSGCLPAGVKPSRLGMRTALFVKPVRLGV